MKLENLWKLLRLGDLKNVWKKEWTVIAVAVASLPKGGLVEIEVIAKK